VARQGRGRDGGYSHELIEILKQDRRQPYVEGNPRLPQTDAQGMRTTRSGARSIVEERAVVPENAARCQDMSALADVPLALVRNARRRFCTPAAPGAKIPRTRASQHAPDLPSALIVRTTAPFASATTRALR